MGTFVGDLCLGAKQRNNLQTNIVLINDSTTSYEPG